MDLDLRIDTYIAKSTNYGGKRNLGNIKYIVIHYTANNGDTAIGNGKYFAGNNTGTSAHYFVDSNMVVNSVYDNYVAYHCGASKYYHPYCRNSNSIGVEMCSVKSGGVYYIKPQVVENTLKLVRWLMEKYNIGENNILRHYDITHKNCPAPFVLNESLWQNFKSKLKKEDDEVVETGYISINGKDIKIDKIEKDGTTFVQLRGLEPAGFEINYNADTKLLILNNLTKNINVSVNGNEKEVSSINIDGSNYIPLRSIPDLIDNVEIDYSDDKIKINVTNL